MGLFYVQRLDNLTNALFHRELMKLGASPPIHDQVYIPKNITKTQLNQIYNDALKKAVKLLENPSCQNNKSNKNASV